MDFVSFVLEETPKYECSETFDLKNLLRASQFARIQLVSYLEAG
jgi:hypothetical protein